MIQNLFANKILGSDFSSIDKAIKFAILPQLLQGQTLNCLAELNFVKGEKNHDLQSVLALTNFSNKTKD